MLPSAFKIKDTYYNDLSITKGYSKYKFGLKGTIGQAFGEKLFGFF